MILSERVLFLDGEAVVIDKPSGLPVTMPRSGKLSVENHLASLTFGFKRWPTIVHRLDQDTSGCLLLARNPKAHKAFSAAFEAGRVQKTYLAVVDAIIEGEGQIDLPLHKVSTKEEGWRIVVDKKGKAAVTNWRAVATKSGRTLIEFRPKTGRTHQLRVHAAEGLGAGIVGDAMYGQSGPQMLLHASELTLDRESKPAIEAKAALPAYFGFDHE